MCKMIALNISDSIINLQCLHGFKSCGKCTGPFTAHEALRHIGLTQNLHCLICINTSAFVLSEASGTVLTPAVHGAGTIPTHLTSAGMISERTK
jgi:hypothetical protein